MAFRLTIHTEGAAFDPPEHELARLLRSVADRIESGDSFDMYRNIIDINGNVVGTFALKEEE